MIGVCLFLLPFVGMLSKSVDRGVQIEIRNNTREIANQLKNVETKTTTEIKEESKSLKEFYIFLFVVIVIGFIAIGVVGANNKKVNEANEKKYVEYTLTCNTDDSVYVIKRTYKGNEIVNSDDCEGYVAEQLWTSFTTRFGACPTRIENTTFDGRSCNVQVSSKEFTDGSVQYVYTIYWR